ncbi:Ubiquinone biosynthesis O-methyltransferase [ANME-1 cluster archaeon GoMg3.2]|nr:Ubiquinone biosynthesis O-methyltransferase [ANME-1 cluster archaeon GoMg3.2]
MDKELLDILACPICRGTLKFDRKDQKFVCSQCDREYFILNDIPIMWDEESVPIEDYINKEEDEMPRLMRQADIQATQKFLKKDDENRERNLLWTFEGQINRGKRSLAENITHSRMLNSIENLYNETLKGKKILNIGCGGGIEAEWAVKKGAEVVGLDISVDFILAAVERFRRNNIKAYFVQGNGEYLPFADNSFDIVFIYGTLHHIPQSDKAILETSRVATELLIGSEPVEIPVLKYFMKIVGWNTEYDQLKTYRFDVKKLTNLIYKSGFKDVESRTTWSYFPVFLQRYSDNPTIINYYFNLLNFLDTYFNYFGHNLSLIARKNKNLNNSDAEK